MSKEHTYTNGEVTIVWKQDLCIHSKKCWRGLGEVFKPGERPWIKADGASTERIVDQVEQCPSGALSYRMNNGPAQGKEPGHDTTPVTVIEVSSNGPLLVKGPCTVRHADGREETQDRPLALCRCGASGNKPFCDGSHRSVQFVG